MAIQTRTDRGPASALTVDDLTRAIKNSIDRSGMKDEEARSMAQHVLNFFGYSERVWIAMGRIPPGRGSLLRPGSIYRFRARVRA